MAGSKQKALPGVGPAGRPQLDSRDWHQRATLGGAAFMWLRELRGSGSANLIYSPRLAAASGGWRLSSYCAYGEMLSGNEEGLEQTCTFAFQISSVKRAEAPFCTSNPFSLCQYVYSNGL